MQNKNIKYSALVIFLTSLITVCAGYNVLVVFPHFGKSHFDVFIPFFTALVQKGHNVTVIGYSSLDINNPNYQHVKLEGIPTGDVFEMDLFKGGRKEMYESAVLLQYLSSLATENALNSSSFQEFLRKDRQFDLIIMEYFNTNAFMGLVERFKAPLIGISSCALMPWTNDFVANPEHPAYIPLIFMDYSDQMSFFERVENTVILQVNKLYYKYVMAPYGNDLSVKYTGQDVLTPRDLMYNTSLILVNTHFSLHRARPLVPGIVEVGGMHIGKVKKLPANIEKWINESTAGVIYFSLGSMIKGNTFPEEKRQAFLKAFARLPQRVLWKWENDTMKDKPDNVMIQDWMPQFDILCHPNVKAFITHGGLLGTTESVHCGVAMLVMPQYGDQHLNARAVEAGGGGIILYLSQANEENIYNSLRKILEPECQQQAQELSERFRDRPLSPLDTAIYWIEYVARHKGARHMRTAAVDMPFYQYYLLDVIAFLLAVLFAIMYSFYRIVKSILGVLFRSGDSGRKAGKNGKQKVN